MFYIFFYVSSAVLEKSENYVVKQNIARCSLLTLSSSSCVTEYLGVPSQEGKSLLVVEIFRPPSLPEKGEMNKLYFGIAMVI